MAYHWQFGIALQYLPFLLKGVGITIIVTLVAVLLGAFIGLIAAILRLTRFKSLRFLGALYVDFFRSTPQLVQLFWIYYCIPILTGIDLSAIISGAIGLSVSTGSFLAEIFRGGILSIEKGQKEAALAIGMTPFQTMRRIILPQAIRRMIPPFTNVFISTLKASSFVGVVGVQDLMWQGNTVITYTFRPLEVLTVVAVTYFVLTYPQALASEWLYNKMRVRA